jgi:hypothetical protein
MRAQVNTVYFSVSGLPIKGSLTIRAAYDVASPERVSIKYLDSSLVGGPPASARLWHTAR